MSPSRSNPGGWAPLIVLQVLTGLLVAAVVASEAGVRMPSPVSAGEELRRPVPTASVTLPPRPVLWSAEPPTGDS